MNNDTQELPWYKRNKLRAKNNATTWRLKNLERNKITLSTWYQKTKEKHHDRYIANKEYYANLNRQKRLQGIRRSLTLQERLRARIHSRILGALKNQSQTKHYKTIELLGCTIVEARKHIESQWLEGMSWDNHSLTGWHIDHILPCNTFDLSNPDQQKKCFHYTNLRPLWAKDNLSRPRNGSDL
jgi:hypothetical protein